MLATLNLASVVSFGLLWAGSRWRRARAPLMVSGVLVALAGVTLAAIGLASADADPVPLVFMEVGLGAAVVLGLRAFLRPGPMTRLVSPSSQTPTRRLPPRVRIGAVAVGIAAWLVLTIVLNLVVNSAKG